MGTASGAGFGGAFIQGLTSALEMGRERKYRDQQRKQQSAMQAANFLLGSGQVSDIADLEPILSVAMPEVFGETKGKKGGGGSKQPAVDHKGMVSQVLSSVLQGNTGGLNINAPFDGGNLGTPSSHVQGAGSGNLGMPTHQTGAGVAPVDRGQMFVGPIPQSGEGADPLPSRPLPSGLPSPGAPPRRTLGGVPLLTPDEVSQRGVDRGIQQTEQEINAKVGLARRLLPTFQAVDPKFTLEDAMMAVGLKTQTNQAVRLQQVRGMVDGKESFGVFNPRTGEYSNPETGELLSGFTPLTANSTYHYGVDREAAAQREFGKNYGQLTPDERVKVDQRVNVAAGEKAGATTTARGEAAAKVPLSTSDRFQALRSLQGDWRKASAPLEESKRALDRMDIALKRFKQDPTGASEAIRVGFEKILDPASVVREGEYARQGTGLSLLQMMEGYKQRFLEGGGQIPYETLAGMVETARQFNAGLDDFTALERDRVTQAAQEAGLSPDRVFGVAAAAAEREKGAPSASGTKSPQAAPATVPGYTWKDGQLYLNGKPVN